MKKCVSYPVDVCCVIIYTKKSRVNQNIEMLLMPPFFCQLFRLLFFTHPEFGFGLSATCQPFFKDEGERLKDEFELVILIPLVFILHPSARHSWSPAVFFQ